MLSDHALVSFTMRVNKSRVDEQWVTSRAWRRLSRDAFASDLAVSKLCTNTDELINLSADDLVQLYRDVLTDLDRHCPTVKVRRRVNQSTLWFDADCRAVRRRARAAERRFRRTRSDDDKRAWADKVKEMRLLYEEKNNLYWRQEIAASKGDMKRLRRTFQGVWESRPLLTAGPIRLTISLSSFETKLRQFEIQPPRHSCTTFHTGLRQRSVNGPW